MLATQPHDGLHVPTGLIADVSDMITPFKLGINDNSQVFDLLGFLKNVASKIQEGRSALSPDSANPDECCLGEVELHAPLPRPATHDV